MKLTFIVLGVLVSFASFAQDNQNIDMNFDAKLYHDKLGPAGFRAGIEAKNEEDYKISGSYGIATNFKHVGSVDAELSWGGKGPARKFKFFFAYDPINYNTTGLAETLEAFLSVKGGVKFYNTKLSYGLGPVAAFEDRDLEIRRQAIYNNIGLDQKVNDFLKLDMKLKIGTIMKNKSDKELGKGSYFSSKNEAVFKASKKISVIAFYEIEDFKYNQRSPAVDDAGRNIKEVKQHLGTGGIGIRVNLE